MSSTSDDRAKRTRGSGSGSFSSDGDQQQGPSSQHPPSPSKWRTPRAQQAYSSKLLQALRLVRRRSTTSTSTCSAPAVRDAAYRALAVAARGRSRWSRAILTACRRRTRRSHRARALLRLPAPRPRRPGLGARAKVLGRLVPGCRSLSLPALLAEVSDYIAALEMQVRAMGQLTHHLEPQPPI